MATEAACLREIAQGSDDATRLVYADWLEEQGDRDRAELIRVCEAMRRLPVFAADYSAQGPARRAAAELPGRLAATGYDGSRYDPLYRHGIPPDWRGRWRLIRAFAESWHGLALGDVGGRRDEIQAEERRLDRKLPPSAREYVAYAHDVAPEYGFGTVHRDVYTMRPLEGQAALSVMVTREGNGQWAIRD
jgi:uncharacterized protein (TIGR02996 family)